MTTTIELIKRLREETFAGILECRQALEKNHYQYPAALLDLQEKAVLKANKNANRQTSQGMVEIYSHGNGRIGVIVEVNCETDFTARSTAFRDFAHEIALHIAAAAPLWVREEDIPAEVLEQEIERVTVKAHAEGKPETLIPRITEGCLVKFKNKKVLLRQTSFRDEKIPIIQTLAQAAASVGENIIIRRFVRWELDKKKQEE